MIFKIIFLLLSFVLLSKQDELLCPEECTCDMDQNLRKAKCHNEKLTTIDANIPTEVQFLDFSNNMINTLYDYEFKKLGIVKLVILNISTNSLSQISLRAFEGLDKIQIIDLSNNVLHSLPEDVFENNLELLRLYLSGNKFGFLEAKPFLNSQSLKLLDISNCVVTHLYPEIFLKMTALSIVDISNNFIIQLNLKTFQNLTMLTQLNIAKNKIECNAEMMSLIMYLNKKQIKHDNICKKSEKFQQMILLETTTEKSRSINWNYDNCDIETLQETKNDTKCHIVFENNNINIVLIIITFFIGTVLGICCSCCYINCLYAMKRKNKILRGKRRTTKPLTQPQNEFLLNETSYSLGLSTPILSRIRHSNIVINNNNNNGSPSTSLLHDELSFKFKCNSK